MLPIGRREREKQTAEMLSDMLMAIDNAEAVPVLLLAIRVGKRQTGGPMVVCPGSNTQEVIEMLEPLLDSLKQGRTYRCEPPPPMMN